MDASKRSPELDDLATATEPQIEEALVRWDELGTDALEQLARHPIHGPRLARLRLAEAWLCDRAAGDAPPAVTRCPRPEELYDYGRGAGSSPLPAPRRAQLDRHVLRCAPCGELAATLVRRPPVPLDLLPREGPATGAGAGPPTSVTPALTAKGPGGGARRFPLRRVLPLATAAAAVLLMVPLVVQRAGTLGASAWPTRPLLRDGSGAAALTWPRGDVLALPAGAALVRAIELEPVAGASAYRVQLRSHAGGAFEAGQPVGELWTAEPHLALPELLPGRYTFSAWARLDGLDRHLGERDFQVVEEPGLVAELLELAGAGADAERELLARVRELDGRGLLTDARALARLMPPSPARDAYLAAATR